MFRFLRAGLVGCLILLGGANLSAQTPDEDLARDRSQLQEMATQVRELEECQIVIMVKYPAGADIWGRVLAHYNEKSEALTKLVEAFVTKYSTVQGTMAPRGAKESLASFRYRMWSSSIRAGDASYRKSLTIATCGALVSTP